MNKTKLFDTEEKYISPAAKVVEMDPQGLICTSNYGTAGAAGRSFTATDEDDYDL